MLSFTFSPVSCLLWPALADGGDGDDDDDDEGRVVMVSCTLSLVSCVSCVFRGQPLMMLTMATMMMKEEW